MHHAWPCPQRLATRQELGWLGLSISVAVIEEQELEGPTAQGLGPHRHAQSDRREAPLMTLLLKRTPLEDGAS